MVFTINRQTQMGPGLPLARPGSRPFTTVNCRAVLQDPSQRANPSFQPPQRTLQSPQTDATLQFPDTRQLYLGGKALLGGRKVEEDACRQCVELHESWQRGEKGPTINKRWQGIYSCLSVVHIHFHTQALSSAGRVKIKRRFCLHKAPHRIYSCCPNCSSIY